MHNLDGFVLFVPPYKQRSQHLRKYPDPRLMDQDTPYPAQGHFRNLLAWAKRAEKKNPDREYAFKQIGENRYLVGFRIKIQ